jgi:hypothetical protein
MGSNPICATNLRAEEVRLSNPNQRIAIFDFMLFLYHSPNIKTGFFIKDQLLQVFRCSGFSLQSCLFRVRFPAWGPRKVSNRCCRGFAKPSCRKARSSILLLSARCSHAQCTQFTWKWCNSGSLAVALFGEATLS